LFEPSNLILPLRVIVFGCDRSAMACASRQECKQTEPKQRENAAIHARDC